ncbi:hypothetical protein [Actinomyces vulturis]|uniref:hypothetical protein n=1 Tax=Actinomyces vulturis TaxID=1857645 RepID=UPI00083015A0|nr:hypothetical protein [Actinomyces vulturis]
MTDINTVTNTLSNVFSFELNCNTIDQAERTLSKFVDPQTVDEYVEMFNDELSSQWLTREEWNKRLKIHSGDFYQEYLSSFDGTDELARICADLRIWHKHLSYLE